MLNGNRYCTIVTDAAYCHLTNLAGVAAFIIFDGPNGPVKYKASAYLEIDDNNAAEFMAINYALGVLCQKNLTDCDVIVINTDSQAVIKLLERGRNSIMFAECFEMYNMYTSGISSKIIVRKITAHKHKREQTRAEALNAWCDLEAKSRLRLAKERMRLN